MSTMTYTYVMVDCADYVLSYWVSCNESRPIIATNKVPIDRTRVSYNMSSTHTVMPFCYFCTLTPKV